MKWCTTVTFCNLVADDTALYDVAPFMVVCEAEAVRLSAKIEHARELAAGGAAEAGYVYASVLMESELYPRVACERSGSRRRTSPSGHC